jgi:hypothetical protein
MCRVLSENIELTFKIGGVECTTMAEVAITVMGTQDDERLKNGGFFAACGGTQNAPISRNLSPTEHT